MEHDTTRQDTATRQDATGHDATLTVAEVAAALGLSAGAVRKRLERGQLAGHKVDGQWRVRLGATDATRHDATGHDNTTGHDTTVVSHVASPATTPAGETESLRAHVAHLAGEVDYLRDQLAHRSRELALERERSDILHREALSRIGALGPGGDAGDAGPQTGATAAPAGQGATIRSARGQAPGPWWRRVLGLTR
jgi:excisionase family DNA binding protein